MHAVDIHPNEDPNRWAGIEFCPSAARYLGAPGLHVGYASHRLFRVRHRQRTCFLARLEMGFSGLWWTRPNSRVESLGILPPLRAALARGIGNDLRRWAWTFHELLNSATTSLLYSGTWRIEPASDREPSFGGYPRIRRLECCLTESGGFSKWDLNGSGDVFALRAPSAPDTARVKTWRKLARQAVLPPLLLFFVSGMDSWLLVDGHDRLQAALLEGMAPSLLCVSSVREQRWSVDAEKRATIVRALERQMKYPLTPKQMDGVNRRLIETWREPSMIAPKTRAWHILGGAEAWRTEARELIKMGAPEGLLDEQSRW